MKNQTVLKHNSCDSCLFAVRYSLFAVYLLLILLPASAQSEDFWICPSAETAFYSPVSYSYGGGVTAAMGSGISLGLKASWFLDKDNQLDVLEFDFLLRVYFGGDAACSGLFFQFIGGPAIYFDRERSATISARIGTISAGFAIGWRFLFGKYFFVEPFMRGGYPYIAGAGLSAGVHF
jgi:hypothetical protein